MIDEVGQRHGTKFQSAVQHAAPREVLHHERAKPACSALFDRHEHGVLARQALDERHRAAGKARICHGAREAPCSKLLPRDEALLQAGAVRQNRDTRSPPARCARARPRAVCLGPAMPTRSSLDEKYRDVIVMKYVDDMSTKEIASILDDTENNVYVKTSRALEKIRGLVHEMA